MVAAWWISTSMAWAVAPAVTQHGRPGGGTTARGQAAKAGKQAETVAEHGAKHAKGAASASHAARSGNSRKPTKTAKAAHAQRHGKTPTKSAAHRASGASQQANSARAHPSRSATPAKPAVAHPASNHKLMVDMRSAQSRRAIPQPHELPPILS
jgi:hypothetical protein